MKLGVFFLIMICSTMPLLAEEQVQNEEVPSMDFLEFLGEWETEEGDWIDPVELEDEEFGQLIKSTSTQKISNENEN